MTRKILIVDDLATNRIVMKVLLDRAHYTVLQAASGRAALDMIQSEPPDLVLLDMVLPDLNGIALCQRLRATAQTADLPVIMVTASRDPGARLAALDAGADDFLSKPLQETTLLARIRSLLRARASAEDLALRRDTYRALGFAEPQAGFVPAARIALIAGPNETRRWRTALAGLSRDRLIPMTRAQALAPDSTEPAPDLFVIGATPGQEAASLALVSELRTRPETRHAAILFAAPETARDSAAMALDLGANDLIETPVDPQELALRIRNQLRRRRQAETLRASLEDGLRLAVTDPLTGLYNRRYALPHLARIAARAARSGHSFAVIVLDVDRFKRVNDSHGHAAGDKVIAEIAERLRRVVREVDLLARLGGEEFLVAMPRTDRAGATAIAERLRDAVGTQPFALPDGSGEIGVTISLGVAMGPADAPGSDTVEGVEALLNAADRALYAAKAAGRNAVEISSGAAA